MDTDPRSDDLFEQAPCGYVVTDDDGIVVRANGEFLRMVALPADDVVSVRTLPSLLSVAGRIFAETHLLPMLQSSVTVREIDLDLLRPDGSRVPVLLNADPVPGRGGLAMRAVFFEAGERHRYEADLRRATRDAETARETAAALAEALQQTLIPPAPPQIPHLEIAAAYRPAGTGREVGGDFYDVFQVSDSAWVVVVGDVSGKGIPAATVTTLVRYAVRSFAIEHPDPADLLRHVDLVLQASDTDRYCTLAVVRLERPDDVWDLALSLGGHPAPLLRAPDGSVTTLGTPGTPVGLVDEPIFHTVRHRLAAGTLTLYTDGVTDARGPSGLFGDDRLKALVSRLPGDSRMLAEGIARDALSFQHGNASDDIAIVTFGPRPEAGTDSNAGARREP